MKKEYKNPEKEVIQMEITSPLLDGSTNTATNTGVEVEVDEWQ